MFRKRKSGPRLDSQLRYRKAFLEQLEDRRLLATGVIEGVVFHDTNRDASPQIVSEHKFSADPGWMSAGDGVSGNDFGFKESSIAGGTAGELGGKFTRSSVPMRLADEFDEPLDFGKPIIASGSLGIGEFNCPDFGNVFFLGHGVVNEHGDFTSGIGVRFTDNSGCTNLYPMLSVLTADPVNEYAPSGYTYGDHPIERNSQLEWEYKWSPDKGAFGTVEYLLNDASYSISLSEEARDYFTAHPISFFGFAGMGGNNAFNASKFAELYIDDVSYSSAQGTEEGLENASVFIDDNLNGVWDSGEQVVQTAKDDVATVDINETGKFAFQDVAPGPHMVRTLADDLFLHSSIEMSEKRSYVMGPGPHEIIAADIDGDGDNDLISANFSDGVSDFSIRRNDGFGNFSELENGPDLYRSLGVSVADIDKDGDLDLIASKRGNGIVVWQNDGSGQFSVKQDVIAGGYTTRPYVADYNLDGHPDVAFMDSYDGTHQANNLFVSLNDGAGVLTAPTAYFVANGTQGDVKGGDLDLDGDIDLVIPNNSNNEITILINDGDGSFTRDNSRAITVGSFGTPLVHDFNNDGYPDIAGVDPTANRFYIFSNNGTGKFTQTYSLALGAYPKAFLGAADFDRDGNVDVALAQGQSTILVLRNDGAGEFSVSHKHTGEDNLIGVSIAELNNDGFADIVGTNQGSGTASIYLNQTGMRLVDVTDTRSTLVDAMGVVTIINDSPVNVVPREMQVTRINTPLAFTAYRGNLISTSDVDAGPEPVEVTLSAVHGVLTLNFDDPGGILSYIEGDGIGDSFIRVRGPVETINEALSWLVFSPANGYVGGEASVTITTNDLGNSGEGGAEIDTDTVSITVSPTPPFEDSPTHFTLPSMLDQSFGAGGFKTFESGEGARILDVEQSPDGKYVAAGRHSGSAALFRFNSDWDLDTSFGEGTGVIGVQGDHAQALIVEEAGTILVGGEKYISRHQLSDGQYDLSFGGGDGKAEFNSIDKLRSLSILPTGTILAAGSEAPSRVATLDAHGKNPSSLQYDAFAGSGYDVYSRDDGDILLVGTRVLNSAFLTTRQDYMGNDESHEVLNLSIHDDRDGSTGLPKSIELSDGKILLVGTSDDKFALSRVHADGSFDTTFGEEGRVVFQVPEHSLARSYDATVQPDGKIVLVGSVYNGTDWDFAVARLSYDGLLDSNFGTEGVLIHSYSEADDWGVSVAIDSEDKIILLGHSANNLVIGRFLGDYLNHTPTLDSIPGVDIDEDASEQTVNLTGITAGGGEMQPLRITATTSNADLIADPTVTYTSANPTGTLTFAPLADQHGTSTITVTVEDGGLDNDLATAGDNATFSRTFDVTVNPVNDAPTIDDISDLLLQEDEVSALSLTDSFVNPSNNHYYTLLSAPDEKWDEDGFYASEEVMRLLGGHLLSITSESENTWVYNTFQPHLVRPILGLGLNDFRSEGQYEWTSGETSSFYNWDPASHGQTPPQPDGQLDDVTGMVFGIWEPSRWHDFESTLGNQWDEIQPNRVLETSSPPTGELYSSHYIELTGIGAGQDEYGAVKITAISDNVELINDLRVGYEMKKGGAALKINVAPDRYGTTTITVTVEDGGLDNDLATNEDNATYNQTFDVTVNPVNDKPTLDSIPDVDIDEDASQQTVNLTAITAGGGETQPLRVTATSSNTYLIADPTVSYTSANPTGSLTFTPLADQHGSTTITVTVEDGGLDDDPATSEDNATFSRMFDVTVNPANDAPTLDSLSDLTIDEDADEQRVALTGISAGGGETQPLRVTATSSNVGLISDPEVAYLTVPDEGLVAHYSFDGNAEDNSGNGHGTVLSGPVLTTDRMGDSGSAYLFDGNNDFIKQDSARLMPRGTEDFTMSLWVNASTIAGDARVFIANEKLDEFQFNIGGVGHNELQMYLGDSLTTTGILDWELDRWYQVGVTRLGNQVSIFRDGKVLITATNSGSNDVTDSQSVLSLGSRKSASGNTEVDHPWNGTIDEVRIYDRHLTGAEIEALYLQDVKVLKFNPHTNQYGSSTITVTVEDGGLDNHLSTTDDNTSTTKSFEVAVAPVNDAPSFEPLEDLTISEDAGPQTLDLTGIIAGGGETQALRVTVASLNVGASYNLDGDGLDSSGDELHGVVRYGVATVADRNDDAGKAVSFNGGSEEIVFNHQFPLNRNVDNSFSFWLHTAANRHETIIWGRENDASHNRFHMYSYPEGAGGWLGFDYFDFGNARHVIFDKTNGNGVSYRANEWEFVTLTRKGDTYSIFLNGELKHEATDVNPDLPNAAGWQLSGRGGYGFTGALDDLVFYDRALSSKEVQLAYNGALHTKASSLLADTTIAYVSPETAGKLRITPLHNRYGSTTMTVTVEDGGLDNDLATAEDNATYNQTFGVTVNSVNDVPTIVRLADVTIDEGASVQSVELTGITAGGDEVQPLRVTATSSNTALIPDPAVNYTSAYTTGSLSFTPAPDQQGTTTMTVTVEDGGLDNDLATTSDNAITSTSFEVIVQDLLAWHNAMMPVDVNNDGTVSSVDALQVINHLNANGSHELSPEKPSDAVWLDVNKDQWVSPADAIGVINHLSSRSYDVSIGVIPVDTLGTPITSAEVGETFYLALTTEDLRDDAKGVFAAYADVYYPSNNVVLAGSATFEAPYSNGRSAITDAVGLIDEWGAFAGLSETGEDSYFVSRIPMQATQAGTVLFGTSAADESPIHDVLVFGSNDTVDANSIEFAAAELLVLEQAEGEFEGISEDVIEQIASREKADLLTLDHFFGEF